MQYPQRIVNSGVLSSMNFSLQSRIRLSNRLGLVLVGMGVFLLIAFSIRSFQNAYPFLSLVFIGVFIPILNRTGLHQFSRLLISLLPCVVVLIYDISNKARTLNNVEVASYISPHFVITATVALPLALFTFKEKVFLIGCLLLILFATIFFDSIYRYFGVHFSQVGLSSKAYHMVIVNVIVVVVILLSAMLFMVANNQKSERISQNAFIEIQEKNIALKKREAELQNYLQELEKATAETEQRSWVSKNLAEFATLLRTEKNPATLYNQLITGIAKQVSALQAALYIINDDTSDEKYIELVASYAAPLEKHQKKQITLEDGLLGQVYTTQKEIYLEQVPTHYFPIQSGLGDALPTTLLILPMAFNEEVFGLIELAAFSPFETYQLEFLRKISEAIATTVAGLKINAHNEALLSDRQAKNDLIQQQATEIAQKEEFYLGIIRQLEHTIQESAPQKIISG